MSLDADAIVDRRRLRRKLAVWRVVAFVVAAVALVVALVALTGVGGPSKRTDHIARVPIDGLIVEDRDRTKMLEAIGKSDKVKGVIVAVNSPGGSTTGGEALYEELRKLAEKKPLVATIGTLGASAGYMTAVSADHVVARHNSLTGSIGVYIQYGNVKGLLDDLGVEFDVVRSGPLKAEPNFFDRTPEAARQNLQAVIDDSYGWFVDIVAERRKLDKEKVRTLANGGIYSGLRARQNGLVDELGGEAVAISWLERERSVAKDLPVLSWTPASDIEGVPFASRLAASVGSGLARGVSESLTSAKNLIPAGVSLDGLVSVWHASDAANENVMRGGRQ